MIVEFAGIPGSGKTTVSGRLIAALRKEGHPTFRLREATVKVMQAQKSKIGFVNGRTERQNLYGLMLFARANPELYDWLHKKSRDDLDILLWNSEVMAQLGILGKFGAPGHVVVNDEGFVQRSASVMLGEGKTADIEVGSDMFPRDSPIVFFKLDPAEAFTRILTRGRGFHSVLRGQTDEETVDNFQAYQDILERGVTCCQAAGTKTLVVDGTRPIDENVAQVSTWLLAELPAPRKLPKARLERMAQKLAARKAGAGQ
jgi:thymidylate kinase